MARYWVWTTLGVALFLACLVTFCLKITSLLEIGTCASGGPYVIANECPEGTGWDVAQLIGSIFGLFIAAGFVLAAGDRPGGKSAGSLILLHGWTAFFCGSGATILIYSLTADGIPADGKLGGTIVGVTFLLMGLPALWISLGDLRGMFKDRDERPKLGPRATGMAEQGFAKVTGTPPRSRAAPKEARKRDSSADARLDQLERLQRLRESGTLTEAEFAREKARVLGP